MTLGTRPSEATEAKVATVLGSVLAVALVGFETIPMLGDLTIVRALVGSVGGFLVPGYLILLCAGVRRRTFSKMLLYSVGTSVAYVVAMSFVSITVLSRIGVRQPLSSTVWLLAGSLGIFSVIAWYRPSVPTPNPLPAKVTKRSLGTAAALLGLVLLAVVSRAGIVDPNGDLLTLVLIGLIAGVVFLLGLGVVPREFHALAVWSISASVLLQMTLVSSHLWGWDIHFQYYVARQIAREGTWTAGVGGGSNSLLTTTLGAATYATITGIDLVWVYKLLYPLVVSLLPVALYHIASGFGPKRLAVLAPFSLVFYYGYFKFFPGKQIVAQFFFALVLLVIFDDEVAGARKRGLAMVFGAMVIVSHYGVSLTFVVSLGATLLLSQILLDLEVLESIDSPVVRPTFASVAGVGWVLWYLYSGSGDNFAKIVSMVQRTLVTTGGDGSSRTALAYLFKSFESPLWMVYKLLNVILIGSIAISVIWTAYSVTVGRDRDDKTEYLVLSFVFLAFLGSSIKVTYGMGFDRTVLLSLTVLAPFASVGFAVFANHLPASRFVGSPPSAEKTAAVFAAFLAVYFLFSSGGVFAASGQPVPTYSINLDEDTGWPVYNQNEVDATRWLAGESSSETRVAVYSEWSQLRSRDALLLKEVFARDQIVLVPPSETELSNVTYFYVSDRPMVESTEGNTRTFLDPRETPVYAEILDRAEIVYENEDARIYRLDTSDQTDQQRSNATVNSVDGR